MIFFKGSKEQIYYSDGTPCLGEFQTSQDPICCIACSDTLLLVARESGDVLSYTLPDLKNSHHFKMVTKPYKIAINSNTRYVHGYNIIVICTYFFFC